MLSRPASFAVALSIGLLVGIGYPYVDLAWSCRMPASEACVWGKAYFPLTRWVSLVLVGGIATGLAYAGLRWPRKRKGEDDAG